MSDRPQAPATRRQVRGRLAADLILSLLVCAVLVLGLIGVFSFGDAASPAVVTLATAVAVIAGFALGWLLKPRTVTGAVHRAGPAVVEADSSEERVLLSSIIDSMEGGVMTISSEGTITSLNAVAESTLGYQAGQVVGQHFSVVFEDIPENRTVRKMIGAALSQRRTFSSVEVSAATADGDVATLGATLSLLRDESDQHRGIVLTFKNLAKLNLLRAQVQRTDQLASLGRLAAGMAHEIRNPLGSLHGLVELIEEDFEPDDPRRRYTTKILSTIDQLNTLVESLLEFSHPALTHVEPQDVREIVRENVQLSAFEAKDRETLLEEDYGPEPVRAAVDRESLGRAIFNVVRNAFQATPEGGRVAVSVDCVPASQPGEPPLARIAIANDGPGIRPDDREKLFTPFFTTRPDGTGLGLPIAHQIVSAHAGQIEVESGIDSGTTFHIMLPTTVEPAGALAGGEPGNRTHGRESAHSR